MKFNSSPSYIMHLDLNSCFATIEQQANPYLREKPIAIAAYNSPSGCIIAPSIEAKKLGVKVGMRVKDGKAICPSLITLVPDPWKYRSVHLALRKIISSYTDDFLPKSIDEFVLNLEGYSVLSGKGIWDVAYDIKRRIRREIGEWIRVSVGIAPNRFLAKLAASLHKPDGLDEISSQNFLGCYRRLRLTDLPYIKLKNTSRLASMGISSVLDFYRAPLWKLKAAFASILGYYWHLRLRGWEIDDFNSSRKSYGNSFALPKPLKYPKELSPILSKLVEKMSTRFRKAGYKTKGIHLGIIYRDWDFWHKGVSFSRELFDSREIYKETYRILLSSPCRKPVRELAVSCFNLVKNETLQLSIIEDVVKNHDLTKSVDRINNRWGSFVLAPARMFLGDKKWVPDRIAFGSPRFGEAGGVKELEEFTVLGS